VTDGGPGLRGCRHRLPRRPVCKTGN
jgi:hypothetical protein